MANTFLSAEWRKLIMANYAIDAKLLYEFLPNKTELDIFNDTCYVSLVGFMFLNTKIKGFKIPFHINFPEVNLRFYVRYKANGIWKRGVVFIKEIVPKHALTIVANTIYKEKYETMPMNYMWQTENERISIEYNWKKGDWYSIKAIADPKPNPILTGSEEEFITEHYWGYTKVSNSKTSEYGVEHPKWEVYEVKDSLINVDFEKIYGTKFEFLNKEKPLSVILAEGSAIKVNSGNYI